MLCRTEQCLHLPGIEFRFTHYAARIQSLHSPSYPCTVSSIKRQNVCCLNGISLRGVLGGFILELPYRCWGQMRLLMFAKERQYHGEVSTLCPFVLLVREALKIKMVLEYWLNDTDSRKNVNTLWESWLIAMFFYHKSHTHTSHDSNPGRDDE
jgi:hypothetical protein